MPFSSRSYVNRYIPSNRFPVGLKWLLIVNVALFTIPILFQRVFSPVFDTLGLVPSEVVRQLKIWEIVTYMFIHVGFGHILWNMLALWLFGAELERLWGAARFLRFYFLCGICAALTVIAGAYIFGGVDIKTVGSSGAIYGILVAYGVMFPDRTILFGFLIPIKSKYFVMIIGGIVFLQSYMATFGGQGSGVAVVAHLGGLVAGYLLLRGRRLRTQISQPVAMGYKDWKLRRAKRKFEVYLQKENSNRDRRVH
ncbi:MAG: rhomboid family intramembrane serine protease [Acidobacteriaceae bacterium]|nr:rhomboid family intramembrane serine protease [Acidobacteriaceae bacterium]